MFGSKEKNARIEAFADQLIAELVQRFPVEKEAELRTSRLEPARQLGSAVNVLERRVVAFQQEARLGIYGKARLLNRLKWELKEKGYGEAIIDLTVAEVTRMLSLRVK
jgi:NAD dependent epimerase/dehydratase family enzyme